MLAYFPFLISANSFGVIGLLIFLGTSIVLSIPVFATRGGTQLLWVGAVGLALTIEAVIIITLIVLISRGDIWQ